VNSEEEVSVEWPDGSITESCIKWYGKKKNEYRLTRFGRDFPYRSPDMVGDLFVLVPRGTASFSAFVFSTEEDIEEVQAALGIEAEPGGTFLGEIPGGSNECLDKIYAEFLDELTSWPTTRAIADASLAAIRRCIPDLATQSPDERLVGGYRAEYRLFKAVENHLSAADIRGPFASVDEFVEVALPILNRRKSRAGHSLEHHVEATLTDAGIRFEAQPSIDGRPDFIVPSKSAYDDPSFPDDRLFVIAAKTTCKDRWRQILREGTRVARKHLVTLQAGISAKQLEEMRLAKVTLIVPEELHRHFPSGATTAPSSVAEFAKLIRASQ
jgi:type II restriction enzyme